MDPSCLFYPSRNGFTPPCLKQALAALGHLAHSYQWGFSLGEDLDDLELITLLL